MLRPQLNAFIPAALRTTKLHPTIRCENHHPHTPQRHHPGRNAQTLAQNLSHLRRRLWHIREVTAPAIMLPAATTATILLNAVERSLHANKAEWMFLRELRAGTGRGGASLQRLDAFALNCYPHRSLKRICYEVKTSRADYLTELKHPLKRRIGMRYSNEFYFVTPASLLDIKEVPVECGLIEAGVCTTEQWKVAIKRQAGFFHFDPVTGEYCVLVVPAPWRETPGPTWELVAAMMRNQRKEFEERPPKPPEQQKISFE